MPRNKDLKRLVRARMKKTGEAYTAARAQIAAGSRTSKTTATRSPDSSDFAGLAGMSDASIKAKTGRTWEEWSRALDADGAKEKSHPEITAIVSKKYGVGDWWTQTVAVGYERIKGLRARGQRRDGMFEATKSRTYEVPVKKLYDAWANPKARKRWLDVAVKVRTATAPKSIRLDWPDGSIIAVGFTPKGKSKSFVALSHPKLPDRDSADRAKEYWAERLDALGEVLRATRTKA
jgi:uncharacterized protein YndB with AHSA1/START domain